MKLEKAIEILESHNRWRRGDVDEAMFKPSDIGIAIDVVIGAYYKNLITELVDELVSSEKEEVKIKGKNLAEEREGYYKRNEGLCPECSNEVGEFQLNMHGGLCEDCSAF
jgi:hypothetical protein